MEGLGAKVAKSGINCRTRDVTAKTLDGLYYMIGEEEKKIRQNPAQAGSALLSKVFGALR